MCSTDCAYDNSTIILIGDVYCPNAMCLGKLCLHKKTFQSLGRSEYFLNRGKCKSTGGYVTAPRSIYGCDNCEAWLFVHKVPFKLQEHVKTTKTEKNTLFLC